MTEVNATELVMCIVSIIIMSARCWYCMSVIVRDRSSVQCAVKLLSAVIVGQGLKSRWYNLAICSHLKFDD